ncbi:glycosyltransferase family 4 protein [Bacteroidales bacterium OttesenSCG-928-A17]|nr:glycosyltransferase family 4 protein [Bacteroidales bacterium OttesenSCG-928-A17]
MKILHCCLGNFYIDNYGYQENILPRIHKRQGHDVTILASTETMKNSAHLTYISPSFYYNEDEIPVKRIPYFKWLPAKITRKLRLYVGVSEYIKSVSPDVIFIHGLQFCSIKEIASYAKLHNQVKIYVDNHADYVNSGNNWFSMNVLHKTIYKRCAKIIEPYTVKFYGTLPIRNRFLSEIYKIPLDKIDLLPLGVDLFNQEENERKAIRKKIRQKLHIDSEDFIIITGGKINRLKNIHLLIDAVNQINNKKIKLIVFGKIAPDMQEIITNSIENSKHILYIEWLDSSETSKYFIASDLAFFPGTHSVLWEESIGLGIPGVFKRWKGIEHVDLGGNCILLDEVNIDTIKNEIIKLHTNKDIHNQMKEIATVKGPSYFSYEEIARKSIQ